MSAGRYGNQPLNQSAELLERPLRRVQQLTAELDGQRLWLRGRLHTSRAKGEWPEPARHRGACRPAWHTGRYVTVCSSRQAQCDRLVQRSDEQRQMSSVVEGEIDRDLIYVEMTRLCSST